MGFVQTDIINDEICDTNEKAETTDTQLNRLKETFGLWFGIELERFETIERRVERLTKVITEENGGESVGQTCWSQDARRRLDEKGDVKRDQCSGRNESDNCDENGIERRGLSW